MADLKLGTTIGGSPVWNQGNFPLVPAGDSVLYKDYLIYSEKDKPQAVDNDFVSKASGGIYLGRVTFNNANNTTGHPIITGTTPGLLIQSKTSAGADSWVFHNYGSNDGVWRFRVGASLATATDIFRWVDANKAIDVFGSLNIATGSGGVIRDATGQQVYSPQNRPTPAAIGAIALDAVVDFGTY